MIAEREKREEAEHQQESKVDLPASRDALRLIQIEVVREEQGEDRESEDLQAAVFVVQDEIGIRPPAAAPSPAGRSHLQSALHRAARTMVRGGIVHMKSRIIWSKRSL